MSDVKTVVAVTDRSTKALQKSINDLTKVVAEVNGLGSVAENLAVEIEQRNADLRNLDAIYKERVAEEESKLRINVLENEERVLDQLAAKRKLATIDSNELAELQHNLSQAQQGNIDSEQASYNEGYRIATAAMTTELSGIKSSHAVEMAEFKANATADKQRIADLVSQVTELREQITAERTTRLEIAKADANRQGITVNTGKM